MRQNGRSVLLPHDTRAPYEGEVDWGGRRRYSFDMEDRIWGEGVTFDDVLLLPQRSDILPDEVSLNTRFSRGIPLRLPVVSAAMDTVTESALAISLASLGGMGVIHRNMPAERQAQEVERVKRYEAGIITRPICLRPEDTVARAREVMAGHGISGIPIVQEGRLVGIITRRDVQTHEADSRAIRETMTTRLVTAGPEVTVEDARNLLLKNKIEKLLIVDENMRLHGLITLKDIHKQTINPSSTKDAAGRLRVAAAVGVMDIKRAECLMAVDVDALVIDTAHGHSKNVLQTVAEFKKRFGEQAQVVAGNVATEQGARDLVEAGADGIKVGIGPGSICTTRIIAGVGVPQLTAIDETSKATKRSGVALIADGGIRNSGDVTKAIAMGADAVMIGNLFAGCAESPGDRVLFKGRSYKTYRGMGSLGALSSGLNDRYSVTQGKGKLVPEGIEGMVPFKGPLSDIVYQLVGGLRSGMGYCGARTLAELQSKAKFIRITGPGLRESHPHDVLITKEAPNYTVEGRGEDL
jgi:IMP dehydrogenase